MRRPAEPPLVDLLALDELAQRGHRVRDRELLAQRELRAPVAHPDQDDPHTKISTPSSAKSRKRKPPTALAAACREPCPAPKRAATRTAHTPQARADQVSCSVPVHGVPRSLATQIIPVATPSVSSGKPSDNATRFTRSRASSEGSRRRASSGRLAF